jgi:hypothetical protein
MRRELSAMTVMKLVGHTAIRMTEYHNRRGIDESIAGLTEATQTVEKLFALPGLWKTGDYPAGRTSV